jgi:hypothetical protein
MSVLATALVRPILRPLPQDALEVALTEEQHVVEALAADAVEQALADRVGLRGMHRRAEHPRADANRNAVED